MLKRIRCVRGNCMENQGSNGPSPATVSSSLRVIAWIKERASKQTSRREQLIQSSRCDLHYNIIGGSNMLLHEYCANLFKYFKFNAERFSFFGICEPNLSVDVNVIPKISFNI